MSNSIFNNYHALVSICHRDQRFWKRLDPSWVDDCYANSLSVSLRSSLDSKWCHCANADEENICAFAAIEHINAIAPLKGWKRK